MKNTKSNPLPNLAFGQSRQNSSIYNAVPRTPKTYSHSTFITPSFLSLTTLSISRVLSLILQWPFSVPFVQVDQNEHVENVSSMRWECVSEVGMCRVGSPNRHQVVKPMPSKTNLFSEIVLLRESPYFGITNGG